MTNFNTTVALFKENLRTMSRLLKTILRMYIKVLFKTLGRLLEDNFKIFKKLDSFKLISRLINCSSYSP